MLSAHAPCPFTKRQPLDFYTSRTTRGAGMLSLSKIAAASRQVEAAEKYSPNYIRVALGASVAFHSVLSVLHFVVLPLSLALIIAPWQIASAVVSLVVLFIHLRDPDRLSVRVIFLIMCSLILLNTALRLGVSHDPKQSTNFGICVICVGLTISRWSDFLALTALTIVLWVVAVGQPGSDVLMHYGLFLVETIAVAALTVGRRSARRSRKRRNLPNPIGWRPRRPRPQISPRRSSLRI